jgi:hypothetical protein
MAYTYQSARVSIHFRTSAILNLGRGTHPRERSYSTGKPDGRTRRKRSIVLRETPASVANSSAVISGSDDGS